MTELLYQTDSYLQEFDAGVINVLAEERAAILDRTAFYPGGGGQPCDFGSLTIAGVIYPVEKVKKQETMSCTSSAGPRLCRLPIPLHTGLWTGRGDTS